MKTLIAFLMTVFSVLAQTPEAASRITAVTVYLGDARVTREKAATLPAGQSTVSFGVVPSWLDTGSFLVSADRPEVTLGEPWLAELPMDPELAAQVEAARKAVNELETEQALLQAQIQTLETAKDHLLRLIPWRLETVPEESQPRTLTSADLQEMENLSKVLEAKSAQLVEIRRKLSALAPEIAKRQAELQTLEKKAKQPRHELKLSVINGQAGPATLSISYRLAGACWYPSHDLVVNDDGTTGILHQGAVVYQATGEDWSDVQLQVNSEFPTAISQAQKPQAEAADISALAAMLKRAEYAGRMLQGARLATVQQVTTRAQVLSGAPGVLLPLGEAELALDISYEAILWALPKTSVIGAFTWTQESPLLPGTCRVFRDGKQQLATSVGLRVTGENVRLQLGTTEDIQIHRVAREDLPSTQKHGARLLGYALRVSNATAAPAKLAVGEGLPNADGGTATVLSSTPEAELNPGQWLRWHLVVEPGKPQTLTYALQITAPVKK